MLLTDLSQPNITSKFKSNNISRGVKIMVLWYESFHIPLNPIQRSAHIHSFIKMYGSSSLMGNSVCSIIRAFFWWNILYRVCGCGLSTIIFHCEISYLYNRILKYTHSVTVLGKHQCRWVNMYDASAWKSVEPIFNAIKCL